MAAKVLSDDQKTNINDDNLNSSSMYVCNGRYHPKTEQEREDRLLLIIQLDLAIWAQAIQVFPLYKHIF